MNDYELADETSLQASRCTSKRAWRSAHKHARPFYQAHSICLHWMLWSMQRRGPHHHQGSYQVQTSRTLKKVRRSPFKILNMNTRKATTNTRSTRTRRKTTHITKKHCATKCAVHKLRSLPRMQQLPPSMPRMQQLPATQAPVHLIPPFHRLGGAYWHQHLHRAWTTGNSKSNMWSKIRLFCMAETIRTKYFLIKTRTSTLFSLPELALTYNVSCADSFFVYPRRHEYADRQHELMIAQNVQFFVWNYNVHQISCMS